MSDIFLNPTTGGGGGDVSYTYLNIWFNTLGATPNPTPNKLALRDGSGNVSFKDISANTMVLSGNLGVGVVPNFRIHADGAIWAEGNITANASTLTGSNVTVQTGTLKLTDDNQNESSIRQILDASTRLVIDSAGETVIGKQTNISAGLRATNISANILRINNSGNQEPLITLRDTTGATGYEITTDRNAGLPNLYVRNTNNSGHLHLQAKNEVLVVTNHGGTSQTFGFYPNGNFIMPSLGTIQAGACNFQGLTSTIGTLQIVNTLNVSSSITGANLFALSTGGFKRWDNGGVRNPAVSNGVMWNLLTGANFSGGLGAKASFYEGRTTPSGGQLQSYNPTGDTQWYTIGANVNNILAEQLAWFVSYHLYTQPIGSCLHFGVRNGNTTYNGAFFCAVAKDASGFDVTPLTSISGWGTTTRNIGWYTSSTFYNLNT